MEIWNPCSNSREQTPLSPCLLPRKMELLHGGKKDFFFFRPPTFPQDQSEETVVRRPCRQHHLKVNPHELPSNPRRGSGVSGVIDTLKVDLHVQEALTALYCRHFRTDTLKIGLRVQEALTALYCRHLRTSNLTVRDKEEMKPLLCCPHLCLPQVPNCRHS